MITYVPDIVTYISLFHQVDEAEEACNNRKAHLVSILDMAENAKVQKLAADNNVR